MAIGRFIARAVGGLVTLGVIGVLLAVLGVPLLVLAVVAAVTGGAVVVSAGVPVIVAAILAVILLAALVGAIKLGVFALKVLLFGMLLAWLARKVFGWSPPRSSRTVLVGPPVADIAAPSVPIRDKYDIAAERELDEELGL